MLLNHQDALRTCCELTEDQLACNDRILKVLGRVVADTLAYMHSAAFEGHDGECSGAILILHTTDQRLSGQGTRGSGIVFCPRGSKVARR